MLCLVAGAFLFTYFRLPGIFYNLFIIKHTKSFRTNVRWVACFIFIYFNIYPGASNLAELV